MDSKLNIAPFIEFPDCALYRTAAPSHPLHRLIPAPLQHSNAPLGRRTGTLEYCSKLSGLKPKNSTGQQHSGSQHRGILLDACQHALNRNQASIKTMYIRDADTLGNALPAIASVMRLGRQGRKEEGEGLATHKAYILNREPQDAAAATTGNADINNALGDNGALPLLPFVVCKTTPVSMHLAAIRLWSFCRCADTNCLTRLSENG